MSTRSTATGWTVYIGPMLFLGCVAVNLGGLVVHLARAADPLQLFASALVAVNLVWVLTEAPISLRRPSAPPSEVATLMTYGLVRISTVGAAVLGPISWPHLSGFLVVPVLLFLSGVVLRLAAMRTLGKFYSHHVIRRADHTIVRSGPYRAVRHPAYAGMLLAHLGLVLFFLNYASVLLLAALTLVIMWRIRVEERALLVIAAYRDFAANRPRLVPGVW